MNEREKFEKWFKDRYDPLVTTSVGSPMEEKWEAWQAALSAAPTPPEVEPVGYISDFSLSEIKTMHAGEDIAVWKQRDHVSPHAIYTRPPAPNDEVEFAYELWDSEKWNYTTISKNEYQCHLSAGKEVRITRLSPSTPNDELRTAAERFLNWMDYDGDADALEGIANQFRDALCKKEGE